MGTNNHSIVGVLSAGLNFKTYNEILQTVNLDDQERIVLLDSNGTKIADSDPKQITLSKNAIGYVSFRNLQSFNNAVKGGSGIIEEMVRIRNNRRNGEWF